jgi:ubiquinone/menaquinone biosynthesis C-methylase UbiE
MHKSQDKQQSIIQKYNSSYSHYDDRYREIQIKKFKLILDYLEDKSSMIFDGGCGTGLLLEHLYKILRQARSKFQYVGVDIAISMLKLFWKKTSFHKKKRTINLILADLEHLPLRDKVFDISLSFTALQNLTNPVNGLNEINRVSKLESTLYLSILKKERRWDAIKSKIKDFASIVKLIENETLEDFFIIAKKSD